MTKTITIDTNLLLDDPNIIYKLSKTYETILIPRTVLKELDKHKYNPNLSYSARNAITSINAFRQEFPHKIKFHIFDDEINNNDSWIIKAAKENNSDLATKDISMSIIAEAEGLKAELYNVVMNNIYNPYTYVNLNELFEKSELFEWQQKYETKDYDKIIDFFSEVTGKDYDKNLWFFIFICCEEDSEVYIYANHPIRQQLLRIDNVPEYQELNCGKRRVIKSKGMYQTCAIYSLKECNNVLITGKWGSGKSLLSTAYSIEASSKKVFITRPPIGINAKYNIGFVPGDKEDKMMDWLGGFTSSLYYIYGNTNGQKDETDNSYNYVKDTMFNKIFEVLQLNSIQGLSLLDDDILLVDEVQLISVDYMSMILSRPTQNSRLIMMGDLNQTYSIIKPSESGLLKLLRCLPHPSMAYVDLKNSYRSDILQIADKLQDKTIA